MKHARDDYARIQDPKGLIPDDEPVFLLRGQDKCAPAAVDAWIRQASYNGASPAIILAAAAQRNRMVEWQSTVKVKTPDMPAPPQPEPQAPFRYDLDELETMRRYIARELFPSVAKEGYRLSADEVVEVEARLRTDMLAGIMPVDYARRFGPLPPAAS